MKNVLKKMLWSSLALSMTLVLQGCAPEVGSPEWCTNMKEKPKGDWSMNEAADFAKNCLLK